MANNIKGITIDIDGNVTGLNKALKSVNKNIKDTSSDLREVEKLLKLDPGNAELLAQKQRLLGNQISNTKEKLQTLNKAAEQAKEKLGEGGEEAQRDYEALRREIIQNEQQLTRLENEAQETGKALQDGGKGGADALEDTAENAKKAERNLDGLKAAGKAVGSALAAGLAAASAASIALVKNLSEMSVTAAEYADNILTMSTVTGIGTDELQAYNYAAELVDVSTETLTKSMAKNIKSMTNAAKGSAAYADAYERLDVAVVDSNGHLRDSRDVYWDVIDSLGRIEDDTERDSIAMQLFGKSAQELNPLIEAGSETIKEFADEARNMGAILSADALERLGQFDDTIQRLKSGAEAAKNTLGLVLLPELQAMSDGAVDILGEVTTGLQDANGDWQKIQDTISDGVKDITGVFADEAPKIIDTISNVATSFLSAFSDNADQIGNVFGDIVVDVANTAPDIIRGAGNLVKAFVKGLDGKKVISAVKDIVLSAVDTIVDSAPELIEGASELVGDLIAELPSITAGIIERIPDIVESIAVGLIKGTATIGKAFGDMFSSADEELDAVKQKLSDAAAAVTPFSDAMDDAIERFDSSRLLSSLGNTVSDIDSEIADTEAKITEVLKSAMQEQQGIRDEDIENIKNYQDKLKALELEKLSIYTDQQGAINTAASLAVSSGSITIEESARLMGEAATAYNEASSAADSIFQNALTETQNLLNAGVISVDEWNAANAEARAANEANQTAIREQYEQTAAAIQNSHQKMILDDKQTWDALSQSLNNYRNNTNNDIVNFGIDMAMNYTLAGEKAASAYGEALSKLDIETANAFLTTSATIVAGGGRLTSDSENAVKSILSVFEGLPDAMDDTGRATLLALAAGLESDIPILTNAASMTSDEIVTAIKNGLNISDHGGGDIGGEFTSELAKGIEDKKSDAQKASSAVGSAAKSELDKKIPEAKTSGGFFGIGFANGIRNQQGSVASAAYNIGRAAVQQLRSAIEQGSPSKLTIESGEFFAEGFAIGIRNNSHLAEESVQSMADSAMGIINDMTSTAPTINANIGTSAAQRSAYGNTSSVYNSSTIGDINLYVNAPNVANVDELADIVSQKINTSIVMRRAMT